MSGIFRKLLDVGVEVVRVPVAVTSDVLTFGGLATERDKTYTREALEELADRLDELVEGE